MQRFCGLDILILSEAAGAVTHLFGALRSLPGNASIWMGRANHQGKLLSVAYRKSRPLISSHAREQYRADKCPVYGEGPSREALEGRVCFSIDAGPHPQNASRY
jgi:hypothetical protein